ncbi:DUF6482 family protein [Alteromonas sp. CYL-A6]|uniref:DUF6482 family protein n=1 Tax=Alteromonas nitratireducens TaxID=3390813 RepID=UPI0034B71105
MHKFYFDDVTELSMHIEYLEVQSYEMNVYLVYLSSGGKSGMVYDRKKYVPKRFNSTGQIREVFAHCQVDKAVMKHDSPYDEMIGNPPKSKEQMALPFTMDLPY